ncbi:Hypothetical protein LRC_16510 [Ligilactobacillus ruminis ATCC 27782]|uniref:Uncharacterized protein n=1 Tax=Ligilactobacillus ruminis (strain ATCC 27782 / RF3) TaxID=1069534 RepID=G2SRU6_LIGR2|nr:Hypothetical protein LRC_16510 [Ligilactobacillus ruminis ATCC 27782]
MNNIILKKDSFFMQKIKETPWKVNQKQTASVRLFI